MELGKLGVRLALFSTDFKSWRSIKTRKNPSTSLLIRITQPL